LTTESEGEQDHHNTNKVQEPENMQRRDDGQQARPAQITQPQHRQAAPNPVDQRSSEQPERQVRQPLSRPDNADLDVAGLQVHHDKDLDR
jgi:hypothetical protein